MLYTYKLLSLVKAVDGDTVDLVLDVGFHLTKTDRFRLTIVDTPERGQTDYLAAKWFTESWIGDKLADGFPVYVTTHKTDSFGRWLADIWIPGDESLSSALLQYGLAKVWS